MIVLSVLGNLSLALVTATMSFRIYKSVLAAVNKTNEGHPFKVSKWSDRYKYTETHPGNKIRVSWHISSCTEYLESGIDNIDMKDIFE